MARLLAGGVAEALAEGLARLLAARVAVVLAGAVAETLAGLLLGSWANAVASPPTAGALPSTAMACSSADSCMGL